MDHAYLNSLANLQALASMGSTRLLIDMALGNQPVLAVEEEDDLLDLIASFRLNRRWELNTLADPTGSETDPFSPAWGATPADDHPLLPRARRLWTIGVIRFHPSL